MASSQVCILTQSIPSVAGSRRLTLKAAQGDQGGIQDEPAVWLWVQPWLP